MISLRFNLIQGNSINLNPEVAFCLLNLTYQFTFSGFRNESLTEVAKKLQNLLTNKRTFSRYLGSIALADCCFPTQTSFNSWSAFDATRSDRDFLCQAIAVALDNGAKTIGIPDSLGVALPEQFGELIQVIYDRVSHLDRAILSVHCHDDRAMAVENAIAAMDSGARQIECTIDGLGARKGNSDLAKIVYAIIDRTGYKTSIQTNYLSQVSELVRHTIEVNKP